MVGLLGDRISPQMRDRLGLLSVGFGQLGAGQPVDLSMAREAVMARQQEAERRRALEQSGILERFSPDQRAVLAMAEPGAAIQMIAQSLFAEPEAVNLQTFTGPDGVVYEFNPRTGATRALTGAETPEGTDMVRIVSGEEAAKFGLSADGTFEVTFTPEGSLKNVSAIGTPSTNINQYPAPPAGFMYEFDASGQPTGLAPIPGGPAESAAETSSIAREGQLAMARQMADVVQQVIEDPALESITGAMQGRLPAGLPLLTGGQAGANLAPKIEQIRGGAFLQAIDQLRGLGALSNVEGATAAAAIARLDTIQDADEYRTALTELLNLINGGIERLSGGTMPADDLTPEERRYLGLD